MASKHIYMIRNLPWTICHNELKQFFSQFGYIKHAKVEFDKTTGLSKHYGFVEFTQLPEFINSLHTLEGNQIIISKVDIKEIY